MTIISTNAHVRETVFIVPTWNGHKNETSTWKLREDIIVKLTLTPTEDAFMFKVTCYAHDLYLPGSIRCFIRN